MTRIRPLSTMALFAVCMLPPTSYAADCSISRTAERPTKWAESAYNRIFLYESGPCVRMTFRRVGSEWDESTANRNDARELPIFYTQILTVAAAYPEQINKVAMLGVGGGTTLRYLAEYFSRASFVGVELDPKVITYAQEDFGLAKIAQISLRESDGRIFMSKATDSYDLIIVDAYRGGYVPSHMLTAEFYAILRKRLSTSGAVAINLHDGTMLFESSLKTIEKAFPTVHVYSAGGNVIVIASNTRPSDHDIVARADSLQNQYQFRYPLPALIRDRQSRSAARAAKILTDDFSPANQLEQIKTINSERRW